MTSKRAKNAATDELDSLFEGIGDEKTPGGAPPKKTSTTKAGGKAGGKAKSGGASGSGGPDKDILAELENELGEQVSRPHTPRVKDIAGAAGSPARRAAAGTPPPLTDTTTTLPRRSGESAKASYSARNSTDERVPARPVVVESAAATSSAADNGGGETQSGGGWWGGILSTASMAVKQAGAAVKEIQQSEEAKAWADQVRGNYTSLRVYGDELRHRALPAFTDIINTLAPPITSHERLYIHITHDMVGYPSLEPLVHGVFARIMEQVEGGELYIVQRGQDSDGDGGRAGLSLSSAAGWRDGPWWRIVDQPRDMGAVPGLHEGTKLCRASAEAYANEYYAAHHNEDGDSKKGLEAARQLANEPVSQEDRVRRSDLFLAVQAISVAPVLADGDEKDDNNSKAATAALFAGSAADAKEKADSGATDEAEEADDLVSFAVYVQDPVHGIVYHTVSQAVPASWVRWLDAPVTGGRGTATALTPATSAGAGDDDDDNDDAAAAKKDGNNDTDGNVGSRDSGEYNEDDDESPYGRLPEEIREIVESGNVDPREWVAEWIEETLSLAVGIVAQRYVARRTGVGAGYIGRGKRPIEDDRLVDSVSVTARAGLH